MSNPTNNTQAAATETQVENVNTTLHLRGSKSPEPVNKLTDEPELQRKPKVKWVEGTVDNEFMNKKKSKICCIFHPQKNFDESDDECSCGSSSSSSSSSESDTDNESKSNNKNDRKKKLTKKLPTPNSYEFQPDYTKKHEHTHKHNHDK